MPTGKFLPPLSFLFFSVDRYAHSAPAAVQERGQILSLASSADVYETRHLVYLFLNAHQKGILVSQKLLTIALCVEVSVTELARESASV